MPASRAETTRAHWLDVLAKYKQEGNGPDVRGMWAPRLDATEALQTEALHFIQCIENNTKPETDGHAGLRLVRIVEAAEQSLRARGQLVEIV